MQRHMDHFRSAKLYQGDELILDHLDGYIGYRQKSSTRKEWHGYFLVQADQHLDPSIRYRLELDDGSVAMVNASDIRDCSTADGGMHAVEFYVVGDLRAAGRARSKLDKGAHRLSN